METPSLLLRPWRPQDAPELRAAIDESLDALRPWISWAHEEPTTVEELRARLARYAAEFEAGERWRYAVVDCGDGAIVGGASLHPYPGPGALEVGYWVRRSRMGRGIARAAAAALTRHAFESHRVERVEIWTDPGNHASERVALSLGFVLAGPLETSRADGSPRTVNVFRLHDLLALRPAAGDVRVEPSAG